LSSRDYLPLFPLPLVLYGASGTCILIHLMQIAALVVDDLFLTGLIISSHPYGFVSFPRYKGILLTSEVIGATNRPSVPLTDNRFINAMATLLRTFINACTIACPPRHLLAGHASHSQHI
jgi:hypothetical protein